MLQTLAQVKASSVRNIAGCCPDSSQFRQLVNDATRRLMSRGDFEGTVVPIHVCVKNGCVTFPRYVDHVRAVNRCNVPLPVTSLWYRFLDHGDFRCCINGAAPPIGLSGFGTMPTYNSVFGDGRFIRAYPDCSADVGKTITLFGVDNNDQPLRTNNGDGTYSDGWTLTLALPYVSTTDYVRRIDRVVKDYTQCMVRLYAYDATLDALEDIAIYEPTETNPQYQRYTLQAGCCSGTACGESKSIMALVKLRFIEAVADTDLVLIQNQHALKLMIQAMKYEESGERAAARAYEMDAIRELNLDLSNAVPEAQIAVRDQVFNGVPIGRMQCF